MIRLVLVLAGFPLRIWCGPDNDFKSVFNKAFFDQLQAADQAQPVIFQTGPSKPQSGSREQELDQKLQSLVSGGAQPGFAIEIINEDAQPGPIQAEAVRELFPGPVQFEFGADRGGAQSFQEPDPMVMDMLSSMDNVVQEVVAPVIHQMQPASMAPLSCQQEVSSLCPKARSQIHCLGQNSGVISDSCRRDVGKSVPFRCSSAIDKYCDILKAGILDCLHKHMDDVGADCKDAVLATSKAITALNTVKAVATPAPQALLAKHPDGRASDREKTLDSKLASLTTKGPSVVSMIKEAERQAEDQLAKDADKIESLLSQMSEKIGPKPSAAPRLGHSHSSWWTSYSALAILLLLLLAYFFTQTDEGRKVWHRMRMATRDGRPLLGKKDLEMPFPYDNEFAFADIDSPLPSRGPECSPGLSMTSRSSGPARKLPSWAAGRKKRHRLPQPP